MPRNAKRRRICFVTGTRAEFGLMRTTLRAIAEHPKLQLQIIATGMHLSKAHGSTLTELHRDGWTIDATVPWLQCNSAQQNAISVGRATGGIASALARLKSDVVLVVGDRVEAFAAASAGHVGGRVVAHVHGGDRALGQIDDSLRHAITKLSHIHFPATRSSADRILKLGEDRWRIFKVGSPGIDGIRSEAIVNSGLPRGRFALLILHPVDVDARLERSRARATFDAVRRTGFEQIVVVYPNNDPGSEGIIETWTALEKNEKTARTMFFPNLARPAFLGFLRDAAVIVGNSSSGIIEAASFGTPVVNIGPRQLGRERSENVTDVPYGQAPVEKALKRIWRNGNPKRFPSRNVYGGNGTAKRIADVLASVPIDERLMRKLISY